LLPQWASKIGGTIATTEPLHALLQSLLKRVESAWGCGVFANDPRQTALDFRHALEGDFAGAFARVVFAIADWSDVRRFLRPFSQVFSDDEDSV